MGLKEIIVKLESGETLSKYDIYSRIKQIRCYLNKYGKKLYKCIIEDSCKPSQYFYSGYSADDISDTTELYDLFYNEDEDGFTIFDRCFVRIEEV